jgi:hypothetical protein
MSLWNAGSRVKTFSAAIRRTDAGRVAKIVIVHANDTAPRSLGTAYTSVSVAYRS